jgi:GNAT superfamily N-acetyltransferase
MMNYAIRKMDQSDVAAVTESFTSRGKRLEQYAQYFEENRRGERVTLVAVVDERVVGYTNVLWESDYKSFRQNGIPEINDLNVIDEFQNRGIGTALIFEAERIAAEAGKTIVGIGVGVTPDYATAQRLYPKLSYVPDGRGIRTTQYGDEIYLTKEL